MDLRDKLRAIASQKKTPAELRFSPAVEDLVPGRTVTTPFGEAFVREEELPATACHGGRPLATFLSARPHVLAILGRDEHLAHADLSRALFLDIETTGLTGGGGTFVIMVGVARFRGPCLVVHQYFLRHYLEEAAMLHALATNLSPSLLITFNGKAFDRHVLRDRHTFARVAAPYLDVPHLDLLYPSRRLWSHRLRERSLASLERVVLRVVRTGDVPGELIPRLYFDYLHYRDASMVPSIFAHNRTDLLSLVALFINLHAHVAETPGAQVAPSDLLSLARLHQDCGRTEETRQCYERVLRETVTPQVRTEARERLAGLYKKLGRWQEAASLWRAAVEDAPPSLTACIELAKYYEHRCRDYPRARDMVLVAMKLAGQDGYPHAAVAGLKRRLDRLERKMGQSGTRCTARS